MFSRIKCLACLGQKTIRDYRYRGQKKKRLVEFQRQCTKCKGTGYTSRKFSSAAIDPRRNKFSCEMAEEPE